MRKWLCLGSLACCLLVTVPALSAEKERSLPSLPEELVDAWERFQRVLHEWGGRMWEGLGRPSARESQPAISQMLSQKEALGLSAEQVRKLEQLRDGFERQSIRNDADVRIIELDIAALLENDPVDLTQLEAKMRASEKLRTDLRVARIHAIEQARGLLNAEQKKKFQALSPRPWAPRVGQNPSAQERDHPTR